MTSLHVVLWLWKNPFDTVYLDALNTYRALASLSVTIHMPNFERIEIALPMEQRNLHLYLGQATFSPTIFDVLCQFPALTSLGFGSGAFFDAWRLEALIDGPARLVTLKCITLDVVYSERGYCIKEDSQGVPPDWVMPDFTVDTHPVRFGYDVIVGLLALAEDNGVNVDRMTVKAINVMDEYECEAVLCATSHTVTSHAIKTANFTELRTWWGDEEVDEMLEG
ncbi:hypothetical protein JCM5296_004231 [Sporobolomyces johnsonii]